MAGARRLLLASGGGGSFVIPGYPDPTLVSVTSAPNGGWTQTSGPKAVYLAGYTYFGYVDGSNGNIEVGYYKHADASVAAGILKNALEAPDTHDGPSFWIRASDHKLVAWYSKHDGNTIYQRVSTNSLDSDPILAGGFVAETSLDANLGGTAYTYPQVGETGGLLWLEYRDHEDSLQTGILTFSTSSDGGATWAAETQTVKRSLFPIYAMVHYGSSRIDVAFSNANGVTDAHVSMYHMYWEAGDWHQTDGTVISASLPFAPSDATLVHDGSAYPNAWPTGVTVDGSGRPVILYESLDTANGNNYTVKYARWNGSSWVASTVATFSDSGLALVSHSALDETTGDTAWVALPVSGVFEMYRYRTPDQGASWIGTQITSGSSGSGNVYPANVHDRDASLRAIWLFGTFTTYLNFNFGIKGSGN